MSIDMLARLRIDPGQRTIGELVQERQWAVGEIERLRLRLELAEVSQREAVANTMARIDAPSEPPALSPSRLLRMAEVCELVALSRGSLYQRMAKGTFPSSVRVGARAVRWRAADIREWQAGLDS